MTDKIDTVQDDENGSFEGRLAIIDQAMFSIPVASTIFLQSYENKHVSIIFGTNITACCTKVLPSIQIEVPKSPLTSTDLANSNCCTKLLHQSRKQATSPLGKPSKRSTKSSSRSPTSSAKIERRLSGMIVRGRVFYLRLKVPIKLQQQMGRSHVWRSLKTTNKAEAVRRSRIVAADIETMFRTTDSVGDAHRASTAFEPKTDRATASISIKQPKSLRELFDLFANDPAKHRVHRTSLALESAAALMFDLLGADTSIAIIDREMCRGLLETLRWLPTNSTKRFPKMSPTQAAHMARAKRLGSVLNVTSVNSYMNILRAAFNFAVNEGWIDRNPARGLRLRDPVDRRDKRLPFSPHQLQLIFNAPLYRGCVNDEAGYANVGPTITRRGRFWVPLIALYSGMRLNEICQLDTADVRTIDGIDCFVISQRSESGADDKKIKTSMSERIVPIHTAILECGFATFVSNRRIDGGLKLFPELPISTTGYYSDPYSKWFRRFLQKAEATRPKTCFHSFRHCFRDALREVRGLDHDVALALGGWASANGRETAESYGRGFRVATLHDALNQIEYQELDLSHLKTNLTP